MWAVITAVVSLVGSAVMQKKMQSDMQDQQSGLLVSKSGGSNGLNIIYGKRRVGTDAIWKGISRHHLSESSSNYDSAYLSPQEGNASTRGDEDYLHRLDAWCLGPVESVGNYLIDGDRTTHTRFANGNRAFARVLTKHGAASQTAFPSLVSGMSEVTSDMVGNDVCYSWSRFLYTATDPEFQGEPQLTAEIQGMRVWDPRVNPNDSSIKSWSDNPALCLLDYLTADYGKQLDHSDLDIESFKDGADACDVIVDLPAEDTTASPVTLYNPLTGTPISLSTGQTYPWNRDSQATGTRARYTCNVVLQPENDVMPNVEEILKTMKGSLPFINGKYKLIVENTGSSVMSFDDSNMLGEVEIGFSNRSKRLNRATVKFPNENLDYKDDTLSWPTIDSALHRAYVTVDNGETLHNEVELTGVTDKYQARDLAEFLVRDSRVQEYITFKTTPSALVLEPSDIISVSTSALDYSNKLYRVRSVALDSKLNVTIKAQAYDATVYPWTLTDEDAEAAALNIAPSAFDNPSAVTGFTASSSTGNNQDGTAISSVTLSWNEIESGTASIDRLEIGSKLSSEGVFNYIVVPVEDTSYVINGLLDSTTYNFAIRYRNVLGRTSQLALTSLTTTTANTSITAVDSVARSDANSAQTTADSATAAANNAQTTADGATATANSALTIANAAQTAQEVQDAIANDTTVIDGSRITTGSIAASVMSGTTVYADNLIGDVSVANSSRSTLSQSFHGQSSELTIHEYSVPASTHANGYSQVYTSCSGFFDSTANKTYLFKVYFRATPTSSYVLNATSQVKAGTNVATPFHIAGALTTAQTGEVGVKVTVKRHGNSGINDNDTSTSSDYIRERTGFIMGIR
jgi:hypothetical protein